MSTRIFLVENMFAVSSYLDRLYFIMLLLLTMPEDQLRGKSLAAVAADIADGFIYLNPLILKEFSSDVYKELHNHLRKLQTTVRTEKFPFHDQAAIRKRNLRLQRLHQAMVVLQNSARMKRIIL